MGDPAQKSRFVRILFALLNSASPAVSYEAAWTLSTLSSAPTAVRAPSAPHRTRDPRISNNEGLLYLFQCVVRKSLAARRARPPPLP